MHTMLQASGAKDKYKCQWPCHRPYNMNHWENSYFWSRPKCLQEYETIHTRVQARAAAKPANRALLKICDTVPDPIIKFSQFKTN